MPPSATPPEPPPRHRDRWPWRRRVFANPLRLLRDDNTVRLMAVGVLVGVIGGLAAGAFDMAMVGFGKLLLRSDEPSLGGLSPWAALLGPVAGGIFAGLAIAHGTRDGKPGGIPDIIDATVNRGGRMSLRDGLATAVSAAAVVGTGHSGGREGPIAQLGAAATAHVCRRLKLPPSRARVLVAAGAGAGIAASFNTPVGGAFFALEIILGNFALEMFGPVVAATVTGTVVGQALLGKRIALSLPPFQLVHPWELGLYLLLGAVCGGVAVLFKRTFAALVRRVNGLGLPAAARPALAGVLVGLISLVGFPEVMGNGYAWTQALVRGEVQPGLLTLTLILVAKLVATAVTGAGRGGAGIFAPSLFLGAVTGTAFGMVAHGLLPAVTESPGAYGMVGMGAVVAAVTHAPITMTLMLFEMTRNYQVILPLLLALAVSGIVGAIFDSESIYLKELRMRGVIVERRREELVMYDLRVGDLMRREDVMSIDRRAPYRELAQLFLRNRVDDVFVTDPEGRLEGVVDIQDIKRLLTAPHDELTVADVESRDVPALRPEQALAETLPVFFHADMEVLPVVDADGRLLGMLGERDVVGAYNREVLRKDALLARVESGRADGRHVDYFELPEGHVIRSVEITGQLVGRTLRELRLPIRYHCTVLAVVVRDPGSGERRRLSVDADRRLKEGDRIVVVGPEEDVCALCAEQSDVEETQEVPRA